VRILLPVFLAAVLGGCASYQINSGSSTSSAVGSALPSGTAVTSGSAGLQAQGGSTGFGLVVLTAGFLTMAREPYRPAPELAPGRKVSEQDCTRPVDFTAGNLRCR